VTLEKNVGGTSGKNTRVGTGRGAKGAGGENGGVSPETGGVVCPNDLQAGERNRLGKGGGGGGGKTPGIRRRKGCLR